jgi:hypothetical protein
MSNSSCAAVDFNWMVFFEEDAKGMLTSTLRRTRREGSLCCYL